MTYTKKCKYPHCSVLLHASDNDLCLKHIPKPTPVFNTLPTHTTHTKERFKKEFPDIVLGTLSSPDDKLSPVFINNELEIPRLLSFIDSECTIRERETEERVIKEILEMKRVAVQEREAISPMGIASITLDMNIPPATDSHIRNLIYVKVHDIVRWAEKNNVSILTSLLSPSSPNKK